MNYTDNQLKAALAKMLPDGLFITMFGIKLYWSNTSEKCLRDRRGWEVLDTELLHLCWLVEEAMPYSREWVDYTNILANDAISASWQQRVAALAKAKGIEI